MQDSATHLPASDLRALLRSTTPVVLHHPGLDVRSRGDGDAAQACLAPSGRLDILAAEDFDAASGSLLKLGVTRFVLDLSGLDYLDSSGLGALLRLARTAEAAGGAVRVQNAPAWARALFALTHVNLVLPLDERA
jgi:anti-anti-sigma factor